MAETNAEIVEGWRSEDTLNDRTRLSAVLDQIIPAGLAGKKVVFGDGAFTTTGTTVDVPCYTAQGEDIATINAIIAVPKATHDEAQEALFCDGVVTETEGVGNNTTTVSRTAGTTSGLGFWYLIIGE